MFGSTELMTKCNLTTVKPDSSADVSSVSPLSKQGLTLETSALESLSVANLPLVINSVGKPSMRFFQKVALLFHSFFTVICYIMQRQEITRNKRKE